jgi:hypothetical protein
MSETYKNLVFTTHAWERRNDRAITLDMVYQAVMAPDKKFPGKQKNTIKFIRTVQGRRLHVVAQPIENNHWLIISVWVRGEDDRPPLAWQLITLPFKILFWIIAQFFNLIAKKVR